MKKITFCRVFSAYGGSNADLPLLSSDQGTRQHGTAVRSGDQTARVILLVVLMLLSCSKVKQEEKITLSDRFVSTCKPIEEIAEIKRLTQEGKCLFPAFSSDDTIIFFKRLLVSDPDDTIGLSFDKAVKPFGINVNDGELYTLSRDYEFKRPKIERSAVPHEMITENFAGRIFSPDTNVSAFQTFQNGGAVGPIYLIKNGITSQLSYGDIPCYLYGFSNTGRYVVGFYGDENARIILFDVINNQKYIISGTGNYLDYMTCWSQDDKMMAFIRTERKISYGRDSFGDIWLVRFKE